MQRGIYVELIQFIQASFKCAIHACVLAGAGLWRLGTVGDLGLTARQRHTDSRRADYAVTATYAVHACLE